MPFQKKAKKEEVDLTKASFAQLEKTSNEDAQAEQVNNANKLVHCIVTCLDPSKSKMQGEIFSARNATIPEIKKFIPYGIPTHVPTILLNVIKEKMYQVFTPDKSNKADKDLVKGGKLTPAYNVQVLAPLTEEEFNAIKQHQIAEGYGKEEDNG